MATRRSQAYRTGSAIEMLWRGVILALAIGVALSLAVRANADAFRRQPITDGLNRATAFTLDRGEFQIGPLRFETDFPIVFPSFTVNVPLDAIELDYGLTNRLQVGTSLLTNVWKGPTVWAKFEVIQTNAFHLTVPLGVRAEFAPFTASANTGMLASWAPTPSLALHSGVNVEALAGRLQAPQAHAALEAGVYPDTRVLAEVSHPPFVVEVGGLTRSGIVRIKVASRVIERGNLAANLRVEMFARF